MPTSMIDWPGKISCVIFLGGCNLRCPFCQNSILIDKKADNKNIEITQIQEYLLSKKNWLDGIVITGGEPSINHELGELISLFKAIGYPVKLDTNGTRPRALSRLIKEDLISYFALDIKTSFEKYDLLGASKKDAGAVLESIDLIIESGLDHEFRTTVVPGLVEPEDVLQIATMLKERGAGKYYLQQFNPKNVLSEEFKCVKPYNVQLLRDLKEKCSSSITTQLRGCG
ncbi:MAG: anaerobic ribonucleoside-triphosphate reductase activating protein [Actinomycetota bacterium]|nr:anaerobic ribonucleoside-triphosphate reductase activating protein [Actinomycetota bacterium]